jgi:histidyl-tRNA synthetase
VFQKYGFLPLETPAMEHLETLTGKYGEEGDRLIFRIQNRGDKFGDAVEQAFKGAWSGDNFSKAQFADLFERLGSDSALRYDLTVPFARYVVQHQHELSFPFKRYQIQPVWRADRPQKGRYREFYQCDADTIGSASLLNEVELVLLIDEVFRALGLPVVIKLNNRKLLAGCAELIGQPDRALDMAVAIDKLEKIGLEKVILELRDRGVGGEKAEWLMNELHRLNTELVEWPELLAELKAVLVDSETGRKGADELEAILTEASAEGVGVQNRLEVDPTLARGLDYYTGAIIEVKAAEGTLTSSICGGGRYDDLTGVFGLKDMSGVGISFGADRIYDVLLELERFPKDLATSTRLLFVNFGEKEASHCLSLLRTVREAGIPAELYPDTGAKMKKQMGYADAKGIPFVALIGENEMKQGIVTVKDMRSGEQKAVKEEDLIKELK